MSVKVEDRRAFALDLNKKGPVATQFRRPDDYEDHSWDDASMARHQQRPGLDLSTPHAGSADEDMEAAMSLRPTQPYTSHVYAQQQQARASTLSMSFHHANTYLAHARQSGVHDPASYDLPSHRQASLKDERYDGYTQRHMAGPFGVPVLTSSDAQHAGCADAAEGDNPAFDRLLQLAQAASAQRSSDGGEHSGNSDDEPNTLTIPGRNAGSDPVKPMTRSRTLASHPSTDNWSPSPLEFHPGLAHIRPAHSTLSSDTTSLTPGSRKRRMNEAMEGRTGTPTNRQRHQHVMYHPQKRASNLRPLSPGEQHDLLFEYDNHQYHLGVFDSAADLEAAQAAVMDLIQGMGEGELRHALCTPGYIRGAIAGFYRQARDTHSPFPMPAPAQFEAPWPTQPYHQPFFAASFAAAQHFPKLPASTGGNMSRPFTSSDEELLADRPSRHASGLVKRERNNSDLEEVREAAREPVRAVRNSSRSESGSPAPGSPVIGNDYLPLLSLTSIMNTMPKDVVRMTERIPPSVREACRQHWSMHKQVDVSCGDLTGVFVCDESEVCHVRYQERDGSWTTCFPTAFMNAAGKASMKKWKIALRAVGFRRRPGDDKSSYMTIGEFLTAAEWDRLP